VIAVSVKRAYSCTVASTLSLATLRSVSIASSARRRAVSRVTRFQSV
jgi:hypothetical protein